MTAFRMFAALAASALVVSACSKSDAQLDAQIHDYILAHPQVIQQAMAKLQAEQDQQAAAQAKVAIAQNRQSLEHDPRDFVANPAGRVTVTEFYDYRCPHCITAAPAVLKIIHDHPDVRFVFKEFPIFGDVSERAAAGAIVLKAQGGDVLSLYGDLMATHPLDDAAIDRVLRAHGVNPDKLNDPTVHAKAEDQILAVRKLAIDLGIDGTPAFVIGDTIVPGDDTDAVNAAINQARAHTG
ncbi:MAG TPA: DsbA family protein [Caulobacteraceae bacterium]|nr:DsbA family protein [Caulobacteraceae bacterium]